MVMFSKRIHYAKIAPKDGEVHSKPRHCHS